jgi:hypothetical protein
MEDWKKVVYGLLAILVVATVALTEQVPPTAAAGKDLFHDTKLGTNGKSCATCHPGGTGLEGVAAKTSWRAGGVGFATMEGAINACVKGALKGPSLSEKAYQTRSLSLYLEGFEAVPSGAAPQAPADEDEDEDEDQFGC